MTRSPLPHADADAVCLGESMVTFLPSRPGRLADVPAFERAIGGAESNVACALAGAGHPARWVSRVGTDGFGDHLVEAIAARGVDVSAVGRDAARPTGIYFRTEGERATTLDAATTTESTAHGADGTVEADSDPGPEGDTDQGAAAAGVAEVAYYRAGSAASAMAPDTVDLAAADSGRVLHLTGITAALSAGCLTLLRHLTAPRPARPLVSFDVNYRVGLWGSAPEGPEVLLELARRADLVFVGEDEAEAAWGVTGGPEAVRAALPQPAVLVVKQGSTGATAFARREAAPQPDAADARDAAGSEAAASEATVPYAAVSDDVVYAPALDVEVVTPVGAGDAFAAGFLSGTLRGLPLQQRLRHGHLAAAAALTVPGDLAEPPRQELSDRLAALSDQEWGGLHLGPGWPERGGPQQEPPPAGSRAHGVQRNDPAQPNTREVGAP